MIRQVALPDLDSADVRSALHFAPKRLTGDPQSNLHDLNRLVSSAAAELDHAVNSQDRDRVADAIAALSKLQERLQECLADATAGNGRRAVQRGRGRAATALLDSL